MPHPASRDLTRTLKLYAAGHATLLVGAWAMHVTGSMLPMALAGSAGLLLTVPLVRHVIARAAARRP
jgi:multisubunit Na+/H+ antiporter MnhG subunit